MGIRFSKSFKVAPGVRVRLNAKSTSISLGGKGLRYTANSRGRRTTTVSVPGTGMSVRHTSGRRKTSTPRAMARPTRPATRPARPAATRPARPAARPAQAKSVSASFPRPGIFAPRGEKDLYQTIRGLQGGNPAVLAAARCERIAARCPGQRIAALTLAGLLALGQDRDLAIRSLGQVLVSRAEIANDDLLRRYSPIQYLSIHAVNPPAAVPLSRDLVATLLVQLHMAAGQLDWAESAAAQLKDTPVADALRLQIATRQQQGVATQPPPR
jgi:hypothetical protein